jgi:hypothetical protein
MNKSLRLILGVRELPRPKGEGYLYYKTPSSNNEENFLAYLPLNNLSDEEFSDIVGKAISKLKSQLAKKGMGELELHNIEFENIQAWAQPLVKAILGQQCKA